MIDVRSRHLAGLLPAIAVAWWLHAAVAAETTNPAPHHCLWRVRSGSNSVYFLGSIHFLRKDIYPLPEPFEAAYRQAALVAFETDLAALSLPETRNAMLRAGRCAEGETLRDYLSRDTYSLLRSNLTVLLGSGDALDACQPWLAAISFMIFKLNQLGFDPDDGVDQHFFTRASRDHKEILSLEDPGETTRILAGLSRADQEAMVRETLEEAGHLMTEMTALVAAWTQGDVETIDRTLLATVRRYPSVYRELLVARNARWLPKIERLLQTPGKPALVVVGAGHLIGSDSLLEGLRKKGFCVEQW